MASRPAGGAAPACGAPIAGAAVAIATGMGAIDPGDKKSFDVHLNIVPFIDLMSCLVAFLLVTAVWSNHARLDVSPSDRAPGGLPSPSMARISVLLDGDHLYVGASEIAFDPLRAPARDWAALSATLARLRQDEAFDGRRDLELAADSTGAHPVEYRDLIAAMDVAAAAGFDRVRVVSPRELTTRFGVVE